MSPTLAARVAGQSMLERKMLLSFPLMLVFAFLQVPLLKRHYSGKDNPFAQGGQLHVMGYEEVGRAPLHL